jgi:hypothetical protein
MTTREALATHLGWDISEIEYYQPRTWSRKIVTADDNWYCATRSYKTPVVTSTHGVKITDWKLAETIGYVNVWMRDSSR